jgi:hypothetical protein
LAQIEELIAYLSAHYSKFLPEDMRAFYASILNYYIRNIQSGKRYLEKHLWNLYQTMMRQGLLFSPEGHIEAATYRNVVSLLIVMENYSEAEMVITTWNRYRQVEHREVMLNHISAFYYFRRENYKESLRFLQKLPPSGQLFETESRQLLIEIYFELQEWEFMYASINSFKAFLRRNKVVNAQRKAMYYNFIKIITQLHGATFGQAVSFKHLKEKIYTLKIPHRQWLEAKYEDLVGKDHS